MRRLAALTAVVFVLSLPASIRAHPGHDHKVMGTIISIDGDHLLVKSSNGHELSFDLTKTTTLLRGKGKGAAADLKVGMRVVVNVGEGEEPLRAKELQYSVAKAAAAAK